MNTTQSWSDWKEKLSSSIELGEAAELRLKQYLESMGFLVEKSKGETIGWDLQVTFRGNGNTKKIEVKTDFKSSKSGRVAIELYKMVGDEVVYSGLSATQAEYYVYCFPGDDQYYMISTKQLRLLHEDGWYESVAEMGDWRNWNMLVSKRTFLNFCQPISPLQLIKIFSPKA